MWQGLTKLKCDQIIRNTGFESSGIFVDLFFNYILKALSAFYFSEIVAFLKPCITIRSCALYYW